MCKYSKAEVAAAVDLAALQPNCTYTHALATCKVAARYNCASVCMKPIFVDMAAKELEGTGVGVGTVINFPHGNSRPDVMALEAYTAIGDGANELDVVMNISAALMGEWELVREGLNAVIAIGRERGALVKVILETCYLHVTHIREACLQCADAGADFVKTSTGFGPCGATERGVILMSDTVAGRCQVKASGGIRTYKDAEMFLDLGCTRLGASDVRQLLPH